MGTWGAEILEDDFAADLKEEYKEIIESNYSHENAIEILVENHGDELEDDEESNVFWLALAAIQLEYNAVSPKVRMRALEIINYGSDLRRWEDSPDSSIRKNSLEQLKERLLSNKRIE